VSAVALNPLDNTLLLGFVANSGCRMLSYTPWYIFVGEFGIAIVLTLLAKPLGHRAGMPTIVLGFAGGAGIFICYAIAYATIDGSWLGVTVESR
jgi:hypothetical protein